MKVINKEEKARFKLVFDKTFQGYCDTLGETMNELPYEARFVFLCAMARVVNMTIYHNYGENPKVLHKQMRRFSDLYLKELAARDKAENK